MANYNIPTYPARRLRYYNNQFLKDQDFIDDQAHQLSMAQAQLRSLCVAGVCEGLTFRLDGGGKLQIAAGTAIDSTGHLIALDAEKPGPDASTLADGDYLFHVRFFEEEDVMAPPIDGGAQGNTRWTQRPILGATPKGTAVPAGAVVLGTFTVAGAAVSAAAPAGRQYSGIRFPGPNAAVTATLTNRSDGSADGALLRGDLTMRRDVAGGKIGPTLTLVNGVAYPGGANSGAAIDFGGYDPGENAPALRLAAVGDNAGSSHLAISMKAPGAITYNLVERLRVTSLGVLQFSNEAPKDKIVVYENGSTDRYGMGLNGDNLNLFCPATARFSLRQDSSTGTEVFSVTGAGAANLTGKLNVAAYGYSTAGVNAPTMEIGGATPTADGKGGGVLYLHHHNKLAHQLRYDNGTLSLEATANGYGTNDKPNLRVGGNAEIRGKLNVAEYGYSTADVNAPTMEIGGATPTADGKGGGVLYLHHHNKLAHQLRYDNGTLSLEATANGYGTNDKPNLRVGGNAEICGNLTMRRSLITLGTTDGTQAVAGEVLGGLGFMGSGPPPHGPLSSINFHGQLSYRAGYGFELVNVSANAPHVPYNIDDYPYERITLDTVTFKQPGGLNQVLAHYEPGSSGHFVIYDPRAKKSVWLEFGVGWNVNSDADLKLDVMAHEDILEKVMRLRPVRFRWKHDRAEGSGFIAQEVEALFPDLVSEGSFDKERGRRLKGLSYGRFAVLAIAALQEMKRDYDARIRELEQRLTKG